MVSILENDDEEIQELGNIMCQKSEDTFQKTKSEILIELQIITVNDSVPDDGENLSNMLKGFVQTG